MEPFIGPPATGCYLLLPAVVVAPPVGTVADHLHHRRLELPVRQFHLIKHTELLIMVPHCSARSHKTAEPFARVRKFNITGFRRYSSGTAREKYRRNGIFAWRIVLHCGGSYLGGLKSKSTSRIRKRHCLDVFGWTESNLHQNVQTETKI